MDVLAVVLISPFRVTAVPETAVWNLVTSPSHGMGMTLLNAAEALEATNSDSRLQTMALQFFISQFLSLPSGPSLVIVF
jgi:hypothetical protein